MKKIMFLFALTFALVSGAAVVTTFHADTAHADGCSGNGC